MSMMPPKNPNDIMDSSCSNQEIATNTNFTIIECLRQLQRLDQQIITFQSKREAHPNLNDRRREIEQLRTQEQEKVRQLDDLRLSKNQTEEKLNQSRERLMKLEQGQSEKEGSDKFQKINKELTHLKSLEQNLEVKANQIKKDAETIVSQIANLQNKQREIADEVQSKSAIDTSRSEKMQEEINEIEALRLHFQGLLPSQYLSLYQRIGSLRGGVAIATVLRNSCSGCHMVFPPQLVIEMTRSSDFSQCPSCRRILLIPSEMTKKE